VRTLYRLRFIHARQDDNQPSHTALKRFASLLREPTSLILGGSAALLLAGEIDRLTEDGDVVESSADFGRLEGIVHQVERLELVPPKWLNTSIQAYTHVLPVDFRSRLVRLPSMGHLDVDLLGRLDIILMKVYAHRPRDLQDVQALSPTTTELDFVEAAIPRIAEKEPHAGVQMTSVVNDLRAALRTSTQQAIPGSSNPPAKPRGR
jgi:hypothetical protein